MRKTFALYRQYVDKKTHIRGFMRKHNNTNRFLPRKTYNLH